MPFGLVQDRGGPCGVLATVQAYLVKALMFGTDLARLDNVGRLDQPLPQVHTALAAAIADIIHKCADGGKMVVAFPVAKSFLQTIGKFRTDGVTERLVIHRFERRAEVFSFLLDNMSFFAGADSPAVICLVYSALLTRGVKVARNDMDCPGTSLIAAHGYEVAVVDQNIRRHQHRIGEQAVVRFKSLGKFVFITMTIFQHWHGRERGEQPG